MTVPDRCPFGVGAMKSRLFTLMLMLLLALAARPAFAMFVSSEDLARSCISNEKEDIYACTNYIAGVIDYHLLMQSLGTTPTMDFCLPEEVTMSQAAVIVMAYLRTEPQHDLFVAAATVPLALNKAFPCKKPPKPASRAVGK